VFGEQRAGEGIPAPDEVTHNPTFKNTGEQCNFIGSRNAVRPDLIVLITRSADVFIE